jgi:hypothetical protein
MMIIMRLILYIEKKLPKRHKNIFQAKKDVKYFKLLVILKFVKINIF